MPDINPQEFGRMKEQIEQLQKSQDELSRDMKAMLALANQSKGGFGQVWQSLHLYPQ